MFGYFLASPVKQRLARCDDWIGFPENFNASVWNRIHSVCYQILAVKMSAMLLLHHHHREERSHTPYTGQTFKRFKRVNKWATESESFSSQLWAVEWRDEDPAVFNHRAERLAQATTRRRMWMILIIRVRTHFWLSPHWYHFFSCVASHQ